jgi:outer membrane receptor for Fe3+-dicitrate
LSASASYVTGTHRLKVGFQRSSGPGTDYNTRNADLIQNYVNNRPNTVTVYNSPSAVHPYVNSDLGVYVQDTWTIRRLTLNPGMRVEWFNSGNRRPA